MWEVINQWDANLLLWIQNNLRSELLTPFMKFITTLGNAGMIWIILSIVLVINRGTRKVGITCALALLCSLLINNIILKNLISRPRPFVALKELTLLVRKPRETSFPSGHTASSFAAATVILLGSGSKEKGHKVRRLFGVMAIVLAALIAFSRLYLGCHYPLDVIGGLGSGIACALIAMCIVNRIIKDKPNVMGG